MLASVSCCAVVQAGHRLMKAARGRGGGGLFRVGWAPWTAVLGKPGVGKAMSGGALSER